MWTAPWLLLLAVLPILLRQRPSLSSYSAAPPAEGPLVSIIVPTLDDARRVGPCLATLLDCDYPRYEVLVADAGSRDGTREIVAALEERAPSQVRLLSVGPAPAGWTTASWSCWRGSREARGGLLLFTRPGTLHDAELLPRAVTALEAEGADLVSVFPRLAMEGFWERLVMPHIWLVFRARLPSAVVVNRSQDPAEAVASSQFLLFRREAYEAIGGHEGAGREGPEASMLARAVLSAGRRLFLVHGEDQLEARLYRSLGGIADELTVAASLASRIDARKWLSMVLAWVTAALPVIFFVLPTLILLASLGGLVARWGAVWAAWAWTLSLALWLIVYARHRIRPAYAVAYPAGALVSALVFGRAILLRDDW